MPGRLGLELPQKPGGSQAILRGGPSSGAAEFYYAIHATVLSTPPGPLHAWKALQAFAVDGSKLNLPRELVQEATSCPGRGALPAGTAQLPFILESEPDESEPESASQSATG